MTVKELIAELQKLPQDMEVIVSQDEEGNSYRHLAGVWLGPTRADGNYYFDVICQEDIDRGEYEEEDLEDVVERCIIYPC